MKKILAILLCLAMLLCITPIVATAEGATEITNENGLSAITGSGDFILTEDIYVDLTTATFPLIADGFTGTLDGGNHSIIFKDKVTGELKNTTSVTNIEGMIFKACKAKEIKNLTVGSADAMPTFTSSSANVGVMAKVVNDGVATVFRNVTVYGDITTKTNSNVNIGLFFGKTGHQVKFYDCKAIGSIKQGVAVTSSTATLRYGGFCGLFDPSSQKSMTLTIEGCVSEVSISSTKDYYIPALRTYAGGFLGAINEASSSIGDEMFIKNSLSYHISDLRNRNDVRLDKDNDSRYNVGPFYGGTMSPDNVTSGETTITTVNCATPDTLAEGLAFTTDNEASVRFNSPTGIRFYNSVSGLYGTLVRALGAENVKMGTIIAPKQLVENAGAFTKDALDALNSTTATYLDVEYRNEWYDSDEANNSYTYVGGVANILEENYTLEYCGIGYISYNDGTGWKTIYASYDEGTGIPAFSVRALAEAVTADPNATAAEKAAVAKYLAGDEQ